MKTLVRSYSFNKTAKTVTFSGYTSISLENVLLITNVNTNTIIYNFAASGKGGTVATNVLTLDYDTSSMSDSDTLQIFYDDDRPDLAALTDNTTNPTVAKIGVFQHVYDGSTWDRAPGTSADGTLVNLGANNDVTVTSGTISTKTALTESSPANSSVGATSTANVVATNANRKGLIITNTSTAVISLAFDAAAVLYSGITLPPYGVFVMDEYSFTTGEVRAIASVASSNLAIQEFTT